MKKILWKILEEVEEPFMKMLAKQALAVAVTSAASELVTMLVELLKAKIENGKEGEEISEKEEELVRLFEEWHKETDQSVPVWEYMGMTWEEYVNWMFGEENE